MRFMKISVDEYVAGLAEENDGGFEASTDASGEHHEASVVAFFDLDRTLIDGYSLTALAWQELYNFRMSLPRFVKLASMFAKYGLGRISYAEMLEATIADIQGMSEQELIELAQDAYDQRLRSWIYQEGYELVRSHKAQGHDVVLITSATSYQVSPLTAVFEFDEIYSTRLEIIDGKVSGGVTPCFGAGKLNAARSYCAKTGAELKQCYFYSDSADDMPLLEQVGHPVICNGRSSLHRLTQGKKWPSLEFKTPLRI